MAYELHVTRGRLPWENAGREITDDDLLALARTDPSLEVVPAGDGPSGVRWTAHPAGREVVFWLLDGNLVARIVDKPVIATLVDIAGRLDARVVGDDGEIYARDGTWTNPEAESRSPPAEGSRRSFFRSLFGRRTKPPARAAGARLQTPAFRPGDRVRDPWGREATITGVEFVDGGALDMLIARYDDGREVRRSLMANEFEKLDPQSEQ